MHKSNKVFFRRLTIKVQASIDILDCSFIDAASYRRASLCYFTLQCTALWQPTCRPRAVRVRKLRGPCRLPCCRVSRVCRVPGRACGVRVEGTGAREGGDPRPSACTAGRVLLHMSSTGHTTHYSIERRSRHCSLRLTLAARRSSERPTTIRVRTTGRNAIVTRE